MELMYGSSISGGFWGSDSWFWEVECCLFWVELLGLYPELVKPPIK